VDLNLVRCNISTLRDTVELVKRAEEVGAEWITVHGRTPSQRSGSPVNYKAVKLVKECTSLPVVANGHCFEYKDITDWKEKTNVNGKEDSGSIGFPF